jgi:hypothetical protein
VGHLRISRRSQKPGIDFHGISRKYFRMTATQVKRAFAALPEREKTSVAAWIRAERMSRDPAYATELARRNQRMDEGRKWPLAEARRLSRALGRRGL